MTDEFMTTRICRKCNCETHKVVLVDCVQDGAMHEGLQWYPAEKAFVKIIHYGPHLLNRRASKTVRGLRWCNNTMCLTFLDRDRNAALNIRRCDGIRPESLSRVCIQAVQGEAKVEHQEGVHTIQEEAPSKKSRR